MSDIPRYKPVSNDRLGIADDADGKLCEYRDYEKLKSTVQSFAKSVLRLGYEVRDLAAENATIKAELRKRALDSLSDIGQLGEQSAEIATLKAEVERLEHQVRYWRIEAETDNARWLRCLEENERLRASSFVTAVPVEEYEKLKAEVENLRKSADISPPQSPQP